MKQRHILTAVPFLVSMLFISLISGCAYFNTFYLAQRNFNDAERIRNRNNNVLDAGARNAYNDAIDWATEILKNYSDSRYVDDSLFIIGMSNYHQQKYVEARTKFDELIQYFPDSDLTLTARYYKAKTLVELDQMEDAALIYSDILDANDREIRGLAGLGLAQINRLREDWSGLLDAANQVLENDPNEEHYIEAIALKGEALYNLERYEDVIEALLLVEDMKIPTEYRFEVNTLLARSTAGLGDYTKAMTYLETMQNRGEFNDFAPRIRFQIGNLYEMQNEDEQAIDTYTRLAGDFPDSLAAKHGWYNVGVLLLKDMEQAEQAQEAFDKVSEGRRTTTTESWYVDARIKSVQIDSLLSKQELIERLVRAGNREENTGPSLENEAVGEELLPTQAVTQLPESDSLKVSDITDDIQTEISEGDSTQVLPPLPPMSIDVQKEQLAAARFSLAELYTYSFDRPDSAMTQYQLIVAEAPDSEFAIKSRYFLETFRLTQQNAFTEDADRMVMEELIEQYPESQFSQDLKVYLGLIEETPDARMFMDAEHIRLTGGAPEEYLPLFQQLVERYPRTRSAYRARFLIAYAHEHDVGDREKAVAYYTSLSEEEPVSESEEYITLAREKLDILEREDTLLEEIGENIAYYETLIRDLKSGIGLAAADGLPGAAGDLAAVDGALSGQQKIRARNARIRSKYYPN